jgi:sRNA-binding regulator protein Hfq
MSSLSSQIIRPAIRNQNGSKPDRPQPRALGSFLSRATPDDASYRQVELFYLQKQIQSQTPMVIVLEDGEHLEGCIEWYDRNTLKLRGRLKTLVYKSAIKYMYKLGEAGQSNRS